MADKPITREEKYLAYLTGDYTGEIPKPITRKEKYLYELCLKGIGGEISPEEIKAAVNEYLEKNPVKPGATTEQAQQINQNKTDIVSLKTETNSLKEDLTSKADKTSLAQTDRKLDALWKLNQGISYEFQTDDTEAYQKTVPSGAKVANVKSIGGKTIVWNQLITNRLTDFTLPDDVAEEGWISNKIVAYNTKTKLIGNHKYYGNLKTNCPNVRISNSEQNKNCTGIFSAINESTYGTLFQLYAIGNITSGSYHIEYMLFDLTQMFGSGNEPSTPEEFEAMFPADYYPYNAGELMSAPVNEVVEQGTNLLDIENRTDANPVNNWPIDTYDLGHVIYRGFAHSGYLQKDKNNVCDVEINNNTITISVKVANYGIGYIMKCEPNTDYVISVDTTLILATILINKEGKKINTAYGTKIATDSDTHYLIICFEGKPAGTYTISNLRVNKGTTAIAYSPYHKTTCPIPQAILNLDGYGDGIDDVCNYVDWENKKYHKRTGRYVVTGDEQFYSQQTYVRDNSSDAYTSMDIGQKQSTDAKLISNKLLYSKWCWNEDLTYDAMCLNSTQIHIRILNSSLGITNEASAIEAQNAVKKYCKNLYESGDPIIIYYELAEEEIIDISDIVGDTFQEPLEVEAGGTLMFKNSNGDNYRIPVSSAEEYLVSLAEVAK